MKVNKEVIQKLNLENVLISDRAMAYFYYKLLNAVDSKITLKYNLYDYKSKFQIPEITSEKTEYINFDYDLIDKIGGLATLMFLRFSAEVEFEKKDGIVIATKELKKFFGKNITYKKFQDSILKLEEIGMNVSYERFKAKHLFITIENNVNNESKEFRVLKIGD